ncbi:MAG: hypothetical protein LWY06_13870 [Firmicutes bacterium]|nr:hypothetical protein [Bacillota bacterium]
MKNKRALYILAFLMVMLPFLSIFPGCGSSSDIGSSQNNQVTAEIGPEGGTVKMPDADGSPEITFPEGAFFGNAKVTVTDTDSIAQPENSEIIFRHNFKIRTEGAALSQSANISIKYTMDTSLPTQTLICVYNNGKHTLFNAAESSTGASGEVNFVNESTTASGSKDETVYEADIAAADVPVIDNSGSTPTVKVSKLVGSQWVENTDNWTGSKVALLVHGINGSSADLLALGIHLSETQNYDGIYAVDYGLGYHIDDTGSVIANIISSRMPSGGKLDLFAHSMGGLVSRSALQNHGSAQYTRLLITMGTPHNGVFAAFLLSLITNKYLPGFIPEISDLSPGSDFLNSINKGTVINCNIYAAAGTDGKQLTTYWTIKYFGETLTKILLGDTSVDGMVGAHSAAYDISSICAKWETSSFPVSHAYIRGGDEGSQIYEDVFTQIDTWLGEN